MRYYTYNKISKRVMESFNKHWQAVEAIEAAYDMPEGYTFKSDVYCIVTDEEKLTPAVQPEEEKKPFIIACALGEVPPKYFHADSINFCGDDEYDRVDFFDTFDEALAALSKYKSVKGTVNWNGNELISYGQFFIEHKNNPLQVADWDDKEQDWRQLPWEYFHEKKQ